MTAWLTHPDAIAPRAGRAVPRRRCDGENGVAAAATFSVAALTHMRAPVRTRGQRSTDTLAPWGVV